MYSDDPQELTTAQVLRRAIPWDIYKSARFISDRELQLIKRYDKKDASYQAKLLAEVRSPSQLTLLAVLVKTACSMRCLMCTTAGAHQSLAGGSCTCRQALPMWRPLRQC